MLVGLMQHESQINQTKSHIGVAVVPTTGAPLYIAKTIPTAEIHLNKLSKGISCLTYALRFFSTPVGCSCIATCEHFGTLQLVSSKTTEVGLPTSMEIGHWNFSTHRFFGECTAEHKSWREEKVTERKQKIEASLISLDR